MNRTYFWILIYFSSLITILLISQIILIRITSADQIRLAERQQIVNDGQAYERHAREVATRIYQLAQQTQDQGLKDIVIRQQIAPAPSQDSTSTNAAPAPASH